MYDILVPEAVWPCWAFALRRINKPHLLTTDWIHNKMPKLLTRFTNPEDLCCGDIVIWEPDFPEKVFAPISMKPKFGSNVIWTKVKYEYHATVYEGTEDGEYIITDMTWNDGKGPLPFIIRRRMLKDISRPIFVLKRDLIQ